jgi:hypothetical protein
VFEETDHDDTLTAWKPDRLGRGFHDLTNRSRPPAERTRALSPVTVPDPLS